MDFQEQKKPLENLTDRELEELFWSSARLVVEPLLDLAKTHTSPSIERSVLLRMGFNSVEALSIVKKMELHGLLGKGAGHVVYRYSQETGKELLEAGRALGELEDYTEVKALMQKGGVPRG